MKIYLFIAAIAVVLATYWAGARIGRAQCVADNAQNAHAQQTQIIQTVGKINVETYHRGVDDIRRVLRAQYTIAE